MTEYYQVRKIDFLVILWTSDDLPSLKTSSSCSPSFFSLPLPLCSYVNGSHRVNTEPVQGWPLWAGEGDRKRKFCSCEVGHSHSNQDESECLYFLYLSLSLSACVCLCSWYKRIHYVKMLENVHFPDEWACAMNKWSTHTPSKQI